MSCKHCGASLSCKHCGASLSCKHCGSHAHFCVLKPWSECRQESKWLFLLLLATAVSLICVCNTCLASLPSLMFLLLAFFFASSVSRLSVLLFLSLVFPFALPAVALGLAVVGLLPLHISGVNCMVLLVNYTLHEAHSLGLRCRHRRPSILKICCTTHYMGLAQARPSYRLGQALFAYRQCAH